MALTATPYRRALAAIEAVSWRGIKPGLERTEALLHSLDDPHIGLSGVLVAGTNGKGSVCATVDSIARAAGLRTVLLVKPHLRSYCERICIDGSAISEEAFAALIDDVVKAASAAPADKQPTGFEMLTVAGILHAARQHADVVVCEVGMGGRLDSTNVLDLGVAVVTNVALDHQEHLGTTIEAIAREKAAIIKQGNAAVTAASEPALDVIRARCTGVGAELFEVDASRFHALGVHGIAVETRFAGREMAVRAPLLGAFQAANVATAVRTADVLRTRGLPIGGDAVHAGCERVRWPGRMQWLDGSPPVLLDAAHNPAGMAAMADSLVTLSRGQPVTAVFAAMRDKDIAGMAQALQRVPNLTVIVTAPAVQRACSPADLVRHFAVATQPAPDVATALSLARASAGPDGIVLVCGSLYLVGEALDAREV